MRKLIGLLTLLVLLGLACNTFAPLARSPGATSVLPGATPGPGATAPPGGVPTLAPVNIEGELDQEEQLLISIYERVSPAVVYIETDLGSGSGFVYDKEGHIVTNNHVIAGAERIEVMFTNRRRVAAEVIGRDEDADIAVLKVDVPAEELVVVELGDSSTVRVGQRVIAIGNPFGLRSTMTVGIVSGIGRTLRSERVVPGIGGSFSNPNVIQTDAAINPGNSGGPLLDSHGRVIGINSAIRSETPGGNGQFVNTGIGFAVPINTVKRIIPALIKDGHYTYPWLGISAADDLDLETQRTLGLAQATGVYVTNVTQGSPADKAGIRAGTRDVGLGNLRAGGDLIIGIDGREVRDFADLISYLVGETEVGQTVTLKIIRDGQTLEIPVTLGARP